MCIRYHSDRINQYYDSNYQLQKKQRNFGDKFSSLTACAKNSERLAYNQHGRCTPKIRRRTFRRTRRLCGNRYRAIKNFARKTISQKTRRAHRVQTIRVLSPRRKIYLHHQFHGRAGQTACAKNIPHYLASRVDAPLRLLQTKTQLHSHKRILFAARVTSGGATLLIILTPRATLFS